MSYIFETPPRFCTSVSDLRKAFTKACALLSVRPLHEPRLSYLKKSVGALVRFRAQLPAGFESEAWLKVDGFSAPGDHSLRSSEIEIHQYSGLPLPALIETTEWHDEKFHWRGLLQSACNSPFVSDRPWLSRKPQSLRDEWFDSMENGLERIASIPATRINTHADSLKPFFEKHFDRKMPFSTESRAVAHGDLHWSNVTAPEFMLADWEFWGLTMQGFDIATLLAYSFSNPEVFKHIKERFSKQLGTESGMASQLYRFAQQIEHIEEGHQDPALRPIIAAEAEKLLKLA